MCPCDPNSLNVNIPSAPTGPSIPGFGQPFSPTTPDLGLKFPTPPDLSGLFKLLSFPLPIGELKSPLNPNYGKDILDQIIKLFDQFMPFLMFYKFFLPVLKLLLCILEVICAMPNPVKVAVAIQRLFRECIPLFLALFPIIALIIMIIALLILLAQIIIYLILLIVNFIKLIVKNIMVLYDGFSLKNEKSIMAAIQKIGRILCLFQNLFTILLMIDLIIQIFKDMLASAFSIPPCDDSNSSCCTPDVCPKFIKNGDFIRTTGSLHYNSSLKNTSGASLREEAFQLFDDGSLSTPGAYVKEGIDAGSTPWYYQQFINMIAPNDPNYNDQPYVIKYIQDYGQAPVFFPSDSSYNAESPPGQVPYLVDMEFNYNPLSFGRSGPVKKVKFKNCIVIKKTARYLALANNLKEEKIAGVLYISGGQGYEEDGTTKLMGYSKDSSGNSTPTSDQATLETFLFTKSPDSNTITNIQGVDFVDISDIKYTFRINHTVLVSKNIITYSCMPDIAQDKAFTNAVFGDDLNLKIAEMQNFPFPNPGAAQQCILLAIDAFRNNVTEEGAQTLQDTMLACLSQLQQDTENAINIAIPLAFDKYKSTVSLSPNLQFTTDKINVKLDLKESSGASLIKLLPPGSADYIINKISSSLTFGEISKFTYDGDQYFQAEIESKQAGNGLLEIAFDGKKISDITPENRTADLTSPLSISIRKVPYTFIHAQSLGQISVGTGDASDGTSPRRDEGDLARE